MGTSLCYPLVHSASCFRRKAVARQYLSLGDGYKAYQGQWSKLKRCKTEPEESQFYIGIYAMDTAFASGEASYTISVRLKVWWDATSAAPRSAPVLLALVAAFMAMFNYV